MNDNALQAWQPQSLDQAIKLSEIVSKSGLVPDAIKGKATDCLLVMMKGRELGLSVMQSLGGIHVIKGKATLSAEMMSGLVQSRRDVCEYWVILESSNKVCRIETKRVGNPAPTPMQFSIEDAQAAGLLSNPNYKTYPAAMLLARCTSKLARAVYPDVIGGVYVEGELEEPAEVVGSVADIRSRLDPAKEVKAETDPKPEALARLRDLCKQRAAQVGETTKAFGAALLTGYGVPSVDALDMGQITDAVNALTEAIEAHEQPADVQ